MVDLSEIAKIPAGGDEVQRRYRYQYLYTALLAIKMYKKEVTFSKIFCEVAEDILAVMNDEKLVAIQIKTREGDPFSYNDEPVLKSICHFVRLYNVFLDLFSEFVFVSNVGFKQDKDIEKILSDVKNNNDTKLTDETTKFIEKVVKECNVESSIVIEALKKTNVQKGPGIDDIESKIIHESLSKINHCSSLSQSKLSSILNMLVFSIYKSSSKVVENSLNDYIAFVKDGKEKQQQKELESKIITVLIVEQITKSQNPVYLISADGSSLKLKDGSIELMERKMAAGGIDPMEISSMKNLSLSAQNYFFEEYHKRNGEAEEIKKEMDQLQTLISNQAAEAKTTAKTNDKLYGEEMMKDIEKRINAVVTSRHQDVFFIKYEILKGVIGILTGDCKIWFSDHKVN